MVALWDGQAALYHLGLPKVYLRASCYSVCILIHKRKTVPAVLKLNEFSLQEEHTEAEGVAQWTVLA